eukprot:3672522-Prymnesium_polylepis.2
MKCGVSRNVLRYTQRHVRAKACTQRGLLRVLNVTTPRKPSLPRMNRPQGPTRPQLHAIAIPNAGNYAWSECFPVGFSPCKSGAVLARRCRRAWRSRSGG